MTNNKLTYTVTKVRPIRKDKFMADISKETVEYLERLRATSDKFLEEFRLNPEGQRAIAHVHRGMLLVANVVLDDIETSAVATNSRKSLLK